MQLLVKSKKISQICVWAWTEHQLQISFNTQVWWVHKLHYFGHIFDTGFTHVDIPGFYLEGGSIWTFGVSMFVGFALMRQN